MYLFYVLYVLGDIPLNNIVLLSFYSFSVRNFNLKERESKPSQVVVVIKGDQKVSVHLTITVQKTRKNTVF